MARPWRLRHKLVLGLALVVGSVALVLGGGLFGLLSYADTVRVTDHKLVAIQYIAILRDNIQKLSAVPDPPGPNDPPVDSPREHEKAHVLSSARIARGTLDLYAERFAADGDDEAAMVTNLRAGLDRLGKAVAVATAAGIVLEVNADQRLIDHPAVKPAYEALNRDATDLLQFQVSHLKKAFDRAGDNHRRSLTVMWSAAATAVVLILTMMYYFRVWLFLPLRALQAGVRRVRAGDFSTPIRLPEGDEFGELAAEFNGMAEAVRDNSRDLARQVNDRTRQLVRSERMVSVGFLAAGVAHEINNPLASIAFCAEALERRLHDFIGRAPAADAQVVTKYLGMMQAEAQRCKEITHKLLDFSRSGGKREPADLSALVRDVIEVAQVLPTARGKRIAFDDAGPLVAGVSGPEVKGVVLNVVVNALESMDTGGQLTVTATARDGYAELRFTDTGCGMTPDVLEHIFEPFFTKSRTGNGTGLGLATSHLVIDQHGGSVTASSPGPGRGSTFTVRLPLADAEAPGVVPFPRLQTAAA